MCHASKICLMWWSLQKKDHCGHNLGWWFLFTIRWATVYTDLEIDVAPVPMAHQITLWAQLKSIRWVYWLIRKHFWFWENFEKVIFLLVKPLCIWCHRKTHLNCKIMVFISCCYLEYFLNHPSFKYRNIYLFLTMCDIWHHTYIFLWWLARDFH